MNYQIEKTHLEKFFSVILFFLLLPFFTSNTYSQNIISRVASDYPGGSLSSSCSSSPYTGCVITLPPAQYGENYSFTIPLKTGILRSNINFIFTTITSCSEGSVNFTSDGKVEMTGVSCCWPEVNNFIEIDLEVINNSDGTSDDQKFHLPVLRNPLKIIFVLDISSRMGLTVPGGTATSWDVLKNSVNLFAKKFEKYSQEGDSISVIYYSKDTVMPDEPIGNKFIAITPEDFTPVNLKSSEIINSDLQNRTLQDSAAMGKALLLAKSKLENSDATKIVMLFTNGFQDVKPLVTKFGNKLTNEKLLSNGPCSKQDSIRYYTIGMGDVTLIPEILGEIAHANGGIALTTTTGNEEGEFYNFFQEQFGDLLRGIAQPVGTRIIDLTPFDDTLNVPVSAKLTITFNENVYVNSGSIKIKRSNDDSDFESIDVTSGQVTGNGTTRITIDPINNFESNTKYYVTIDYSAFKNINNVDFSGVYSKTFWNFTSKDIISPNVSISTLENNPTNSNPLEIAIEFSEEIKGFDIGKISVTNGAASNLSTSNNTTFTADIIPSADGLITISINSGVVTDKSGNPNTISNTLKMKFDSTKPTVSLSADNDTTTTAQFNTHVSFSERITGFKANKISVTNGNVNSLSTSDSINFSSQITAISQGRINININENQVSDSAGNKNTPASELSIIYSNLTSINALKKDGISIYSDNGYVLVKFLNSAVSNFQSGYIEIYSLSGILIKKEEIKNNTLFKTYLNDHREIYLVKLTLGKNTYKTKIMTL